MPEGAWEIVGAIGAIVGIVTFPFGLWGLRIAWQQRRGPRLSYQIQTKSVLWKLSETPYIGVMFAGERVNGLCVSKIRIWNSGTKAIRPEDMAKASPLRIVPPPDSKILAVTHNEMDNPSNKWELDPIEDKDLHIDFDFIGPKEGILLTVYHAGKSKSLGIGGEIIGYGEIRIKSPRLLTWPYYLLFWSATFVLVITASPGFIRYFMGKEFEVPIVTLLFSISTVTALVMLRKLFVMKTTSRAFHSNGIELD